MGDDQFDETDLVNLLKGNSSINPKENKKKGKEFSKDDDMFKDFGGNKSSVITGQQTSAELAKALNNAQKKMKDDKDKNQNQQASGQQQQGQQGGSSSSQSTETKDEIEVQSQPVTVLETAV